MILGERVSLATNPNPRESQLLPSPSCRHYPVSQMQGSRPRMLAQRSLSHQAKDISKLLCFLYHFLPSSPFTSCFFFSSSFSTPTPSRLACPLLSENRNKPGLLLINRLPEVPSHCGCSEPGPAWLPWSHVNHSQESPAGSHGLQREPGGNNPSCPSKGLSCAFELDVGSCRQLLVLGPEHWQPSSGGCQADRVSCGLPPGSVLWQSSLAQQNPLCRSWEKEAPRRILHG